MSGTPVAVSLPLNDVQYIAFENMIRDRVASVVDPGPLFTTNAVGLFDAYLGGLPSEHQQHYNCPNCRKFIDRYGGLVTIGEAGGTLTALWGGFVVPAMFSESVLAMADLVQRAKVTGVFLDGGGTWGVPSNASQKTGITWTHLHGETPKREANPLHSWDALMAFKREEHHMLCRALADYGIDLVRQAVRLLEADALDRSEKTLGVAKWFLDVHTQVLDVNNRQRRDNLIWRAVASAPPGFCHVNSTMINTLLKDLREGLPIETVQRRWAAKMHPLQYQRPQEAPSAGAIERAEKVVAQLGVAGALNRRFARLAEDIHWFWRPRPIEPVAPAGGVFGHLKRPAPGISPVELPPKTMTWEKFSRDVLPGAMKIEAYVGSGRQSFYGMVTAADPAAPPILQWDSAEQRNPVSWYVYNGGSYARDWGLTPGVHYEVAAMCHRPCHWYEPDKFSHQDRAVHLVISEARDLRHTAGGGLFPECLRSEYHEIRSVVEAHARRAAIAGRDEGDANGLVLERGSRWNCRLRVTSRDGVANYILDRWD